MKFQLLVSVCGETIDSYEVDIRNLPNLSSYINKKYTQKGDLDER